MDAIDTENLARTTLIKERRADEHCSVSARLP
jgi:hypothetical protein